MAVTVHKGVLKELGDSVAQTDDGPHAVRIYSYLEFEDGQMLRRVTVGSGLDGKLDNAFQAKQPIELHIVSRTKKDKNLLAIKTHEGKLYATDLSGSLVMQYLAGLFIFVIGIPLILFWGVGLLFMYVAFAYLRIVERVRKARRYVRDLPNVIFV